ncbi:uncharacterized protein [Centroberyx affinis]|uniref:uncharacterized protein n=1 Tax=Centroberyx affinis TaxID=166261 RepID=UPI003A5B96AF
MKLFPASTPSLLHLLLLAQLFVLSASRPARCSLCSSFRPMIQSLDSLKRLSGTLHGLTDSELSIVQTGEHRLKDLPTMQHTADHFSSIKLNESLSQLYLGIQAFRLHVDWLKVARENVSLPLSSQTAEGSRVQLLLLSNLTSTALQQMNQELPQPASPSFPVVSTSFDAVRYSAEISQRLQTFCDFSKRVLTHLKRHCHCT